MSKKVELHGLFKDAAGNVQTNLTVEHGKVFFNAESPEGITVIVLDDKGAEALYTTDHSDLVNGGLITAGASYKSLDVV